MIMGHEMAHALREHAREQMGKTMATRGAIEIGAALLGLGSGGRLLADMGGQLLTLRFGREDESEADLVGLELAARAGYDPRAGVTLWQKMAAASKGAPPSSSCPRTRPGRPASATSRPTCRRCSRCTSAPTSPSAASARRRRPLRRRAPSAERPCAGQASARCSQRFEVGDLLGADRVRHRVLVPLDRVAERASARRATRRARAIGDHRIHACRGP